MNIDEREEEVEVIQGDTIKTGAEVTQGKEVGARVIQEGMTEVGAGKTRDDEGEVLLTIVIAINRDILQIIIILLVIDISLSSYFSMFILCGFVDNYKDKI